MKTKMTLVAIASLTASAMGQTFTFGDAFTGNAVSNPNNNWTVQNWVNGAPGPQAMAFGTNTNFGGVWNDATNLSDFALATGTWVHPGLTGGDNFVGGTFTAPVSGLYDLSFALSVDASSADGAEYFAWATPLGAFSASALAAGANLNYASPTSVFLNAGDQFMVFVGNGGNGNNVNDATQFAASATLAAVPEPSAALLGGLGVIGFIARRRRA